MAVTLKQLADWEQRAFRMLGEMELAYGERIVSYPTDAEMALALASHALQAARKQREEAERYPVDWTTEEDVQRDTIIGGNGRA